jgi:DNA invertase Pin-like site-specific DNA recombinase
VDLLGCLSRHEIRSKVDEVAELITAFKVDTEPSPPLRGHRRRWRWLVDRLDEASRLQLADDRRAGMKQRALAEKYGISLSSVRRILSEARQAGF